MKTGEAEAQIFVKTINTYKFFFPFSAYNNA